MRNVSVPFFAVVAAAALLSACSGSPVGTSNALPATQQAAARGIQSAQRTLKDEGDNNQGGEHGEAPGISASPSSLSLAAGGSATFTVTVDSGHKLTAVSANPACASVAPATQKPSHGGEDSPRTATFTVTGTAGCSTTITVSSGKEDSATVTVVVAAVPTPTPTPAPTCPGGFSTPGPGGACAPAPGTI